MSFSRIFVFPFEITFAVFILNLLRYSRLKFGFVEDSANEIYSYTDYVTDLWGYFFCDRFLAFDAVLKMELWAHF